MKIVRRAVFQISPTNKGFLSLEFKGGRLHCELEIGKNVYNFDGEFEEVVSNLADSSTNLSREYVQKFIETHLGDSTNNAQ